MLLKVLYFLLYPLIVMLLYSGCLKGLIGLLKIIYKRPRPFHTIGFVTNESELDCGMTFTPGYRKFTG